MPAGVLHIAPFDYMIIWLEFELPFPKVVCSGHKHLTIYTFFFRRLHRGNTRAFDVI